MENTSNKIYNKGLKAVFLLLLDSVFFFILNACGASYFQKITNVHILNTAPSYEGYVEVRLTPQASDRTLLFEEAVTKNKLGGLPSHDFLCGGSVTTGAGYCIVHG